MIDDWGICGALTMDTRGLLVNIYSRSMFIALVSTFFFNFSHAVRPLISPLQLSRQVNTTSPIMDVFQVSPPVTLPGGETSQCNRTLMVYSFGQSYGKPFVGKWLRERETRHEPPFLPSG
jgi:hypothetical protein